ncbi:MAG: M28 family peptidase [candidate division KSB1 bacterium]|nr:M28 family peptidase [candidate division KSB1 bacterium]MDZ7334072.1 M28 family peptidase [candidate division KSB1 bacterium]MDZ7357087.1 M28 family peptidase [candidate division KSB1 bacterium]MDZ7399560.1 M28 family peptidase [candidate division KSB1 bacterium]
MRNFRYFLLIVLLLFIGWGILLGQSVVPVAGLTAISGEEMLSHVKILAADEMRGRDTPSPELDSCAKYLQRYFISLGCQPVAEKRGYFQDFFLLKTRLAGEQKFLLSINGVEKHYAIKDDFVPIYFSASRQVTAPVVFAGYGITAPEYQYDDYQNIDAAGKIVLVFTEEPQERDSTSVFNGSKATDHSKLSEKALNAIDHGAVGLIVVTNPSHRFRRPPNPWPSLLRSAPEEAIPLTLGEKEQNKIVAVRIGKQLAEDLMSTLGRTMEQIHQQIDLELKPQSQLLPGIIATIATHLESDSLKTQNVIAFWEGADPQLKQELVVVGAHYDHIGARGDSVIYNGADDNASGTSGVLAVAKAFTECQQRPKRSVLFMCFAGEEKGLFGSRFYAASDPIFPLEHTVAMINLDMIARNDTSAVEVSGAVRSPEMKEIFLRANEQVKLHFKFSDDRRIGGSDHASFFRMNIPFLSFFTGMHDDYHQPSDTAEKIVPEKMAQVARAAFACAWLIANSDVRPKLVPLD